MSTKHECEAISGKNDKIARNGLVSTLNCIVMEMIKLSVKRAIASVMWTRLKIWNPREDLCKAPPRPVKRLGQFFVLFREISFTMKRKNELGYITMAVLSVNVFPFLSINGFLYF